MSDDREFIDADGLPVDPYYNPGRCWLEKVAEIEYSGGCYEFDTRMVWRDIATGTLWTARDSGCSCPSPFENVHKLSDLERLTTAETLRDEWKKEIDSGYYCGDSFDVVSTQLAAVQAALDALKERK
jgi:hypothetical protein